MSENPKQFNLALRLDIKFQQLTSENFVCEGHQAALKNTIIAALKTNFSLTAIKFPDSFKIPQEIIDELAINQTLTVIMPKLKLLILGFYDTHSIFSHLPQEMLWEVFRELLPKKITREKALAGFRYLLCITQPEHRSAMIIKIINTIIDNRIHNHQQTNFLNLHLKRKPEINALLNIKNKLTSAPHSPQKLQEILDDECSNEIQTLKEKQSKHAFFKSKPINLQTISAIKVLLRSNQFQ